MTIPSVYQRDTLEVVFKNRKPLLQPPQPPESPLASLFHPHSPPPVFPIKFPPPPPRHCDHHLLPCDATQLLVALTKGVGGKVKPLSKATWWGATSSCWNRKGGYFSVDNRIIIPGGLKQKNFCIILWHYMNECNICVYIYIHKYGIYLNRKIHPWMPTADFYFFPHAFHIIATCNSDGVRYWISAISKPLPI